MIVQRDFIARRCASGLRGAGAWPIRVAAFLGVLALLCSALPARAAQPIIWDDDEDGLDDRMETVQLLGWRFAFENADSLQRKRFAVEQAVGGLLYGVYIVFDEPPATTDLALLNSLGILIHHRFESIPAVRATATFAQAELALLWVDAVERFEVIPTLYGHGREDAASLGTSDVGEHVFPTWSGAGGADGTGVVVAILDTGINDETDGSWPGHESLVGKVIGGASFTAGDSLLDTSRNGSMNPKDRGGASTRGHGTHVAGLVLGSGGESGFAPGIAPGARAVDVKVIADAGIGTGIAEALDWCIHNRTRDWGAGAAWQGIDVINLSLSSIDRSDGNDVAARLAERAAELGIVVVSAMGNDGITGHVPSPASGDGVIAVGAYDAQRTGAAGDDQFATFGNRGPRDGDADFDEADEQKPDLLGPGVAVLSADGDLSSDGAQYVRKSGTSMATAAISGLVALLRSEFPGLSPAAIASVLRATARRDLAGVPAGVNGIDPRWQSARGWGIADAYAARLELLQPERSQVRRLALGTDGATLQASLWTMRERGAAHYVLEQAPDEGGLPGTFAALDSVAAGGDSSLVATNLTPYSLAHAIAPSEKGQSFWYRIAWTESGERRASPARRYTLPSGPPIARFEFRIVHNAYDHDLDGDISVGGALASVGSGPRQSGSPPPTIPLPGTTAAIASDWVTGISTLGNVAWDFAIDVPADFAPGAIPPTPQQPWILRIQDDGYLNRSGRVTSFRLVWHATSGDFVYEGGPVPVQTLEGGAIEVQVPAPVTGVGPSAPVGAGLRLGPNPVSTGRAVTFSGRALESHDLDIFDVAGRQVARVSGSTPGAVVRWETRDHDGRPLSPGLYLARAGAYSARFVVLGR